MNLGQKNQMSKNETESLSVDQGFSDLEFVAYELGNMGFDDLSSRIFCAAEIFRLSDLSKNEAMTSETIHDFFTQSDSTLYRNLATILQMSSASGLIHLNPGMEEGAAKVASNLIQKRGVDLQEFHKTSKQIIEDANDEAILSLLEFQ
jgi:hypothetical protein